MANFNDDEQTSQSQLSFKEQILAELEKANRIRKEKEKALRQEGLKEEELREKEREAQVATQETVRLYQQYQSQLKEQQVPEAAKTAQAPSQLTAEQKEAAKTTSSAIPAQATAKVSSKTRPFPSQQYGAESPHLQQPKKQATSTPGASMQAQQLADSERQHMKQEDSVRRKTVSKRQRRDRMAKKISLTIITSLVVVILLTALFGTLFVRSAIKPLDKQDDKYVQVQIPVGSSTKMIGQILEKQGVIKNSTVFSFYSKFKNYSNFQSGYYNLQKSMSLEEIAKALQKGGTAEPTKPALGKILIPEGYTIKQIASAMEKNTIAKGDKTKTPFKADDFLALIQDPAFIQEMTKKHPRLLANLPKKDLAVYQLEGYLFPATYNYYKESSLKDVVEEMLATTDATLAPYYDRISASGKNVNDILTLASLVEKEGSTDDDRRKIASVFNNRLANGMALQSNIAILYAMNKLGQKTTLAEDARIDTSIKSPYNIYTNTGLMPGPVDSPGVSAIEATINPAKTNYLYFVANVKTGDVYFAETYEEHSANVQKYVNNQIQ